MKHSIRYFTALTALLLALSCLLSACSDAPTKLTESNGVFRNKSGSLAYVRARDSYYAITLGEAQAVITADDADNIPLYALIGAADGLLADQSLYVYKPENVELPTLKELGVTQITLYQYTDIRTNHRPMAVLKSAEEVADLVRLATEGEKIPVSTVREDYNVRLELLFLSDSEQGLGIMLEYRKFPTDVNGYGTNFLYDTDALCYIPVGDTLEQYFIGDEEADTE